jgi:hypothetical protein
MFNYKKNLNSKISESLYEFAIQDWKSTALISDKKNIHKKKLKECIQYCVEISTERSKYWFKPEIINYYETHVLNEIDNKKINFQTKKTLLKIMEILTDIHNTEKNDENWNFQNFSKHTVNELHKNFNNLEQLRPYHWEKFSANQKLPVLIDEYNEERKIFFKGEDFINDYGKPFYEMLSLDNVYKNFNENDISRSESFFRAIISYSLGLNELKNTNELIQCIDELSINTEITEKMVNNKFEALYDYNFKKLNFEIVIEQENTKEEIERFLMKLKNR